MHNYYVKDKQIWVTNHAHKMVRKILKAKDTVEEARITYQELMNMNYFSIKKLYLKLIRNFPKVA